MSATEHKTPPVSSKYPSPDAVPRLPQTIFNLENKGSSNNGNGRRARRRLPKAATSS